MIKRKALSPVISTLILSAAVIAIGGGIWSFSIGASTMIADNYVNDTLELVNEVTERFMVEHARGPGFTINVPSGGKPVVYVVVDGT